VNIHLHRNGRTYGPYSEESVRGFSEEGRASPHDLAWTSGQDDWVSLRELLEENSEDNGAGGGWLSKALEKTEREVDERKIEIIKWECEQCGLKPLEVDAKRMYVEDDLGVRHLCPHPLEYVLVEKHLGSKVPDQVLRERTGFLEDHLCPDCFEISPLDQEKDPMVCPKCGKGRMKRGIEFANQTCPRCRKGTLLGHPKATGVIDEIIRSAQRSEQEGEGWN
jgi:ssDNA-binding Zn-finger/Zn-ribbon topoisomerase 1